MIEPVLLERKEGYTITLTNFTGKKQKNIVLEFTPPGMAQIEKIFSPFGKLNVSKSKGKFLIRIPEIDKFFCVVVQKTNQ